MLYKKRCKKDQNEKPVNIKTKRSFQGWELIWCTGYGFAKVMDLLILHIIYKVIIIIIWNQMVISVSLQSCLYCLSNETVYWKLPGDWWGNDAFRPDTAVVKVSLALGNKLYCRVLMFSWPIQIAWPHCVCACVATTYYFLLRSRMTRVIISTTGLCLWMWTDVILKSLMKQLVPSGMTVWSSFDLSFHQI